ncbi:MAG: hypothetical protein ACQEW0_09100 [Pseudomonadota bacterium]
MTNKHFEVGTPMPLGHKRPAFNSSQSVDIEELMQGIVKAMIPAVQEHIDKRLKEAGISTDGKPANDMANNLAQYQFPKADRWAGYNLNEAFDDLPDGDEPRSSNGRKMPSNLDEYQLPD